MGFYLTERDRAETYAQHPAGVASKIIDSQSRGEVYDPNREPSFTGTVHAYDTSTLKLFTVSRERYLDLGELLLDTGRDYITGENQKAIGARLAELGFDGLQIHSEARKEIIIFPESFEKLQELPLH